MTATINLQCQPTPLVWVPNTGTASYSTVSAYLTDGDGNILTDGDGNALVVSVRVLTSTLNHALTDEDGTFLCDADGSLLIR